MSGSILDDITETTEINYKQILNNLLDGDKNLDLKSHIFKPKQLAALSTFAKYLNNKEYPISSNIIEGFIKYYLRNMISYKRLSRIEVVRALANITTDTENKNISTKLI